MSGGSGSASMPWPCAELLYVLMLPDFERADRIGEFGSYPARPIPSPNRGHRDHPSAAPSATIGASTIATFSPEKV